MIALLLTAAVACAVLSALEAAIVSVSRVRLEHGALHGGREASLSRILNDPRRLLLTILLLDTLTRLLGFALLFLLLARWLGNWGYLAAFAAGLPIYLLVCELLPKALARSGPYRFLLLMHPLIRTLFIVPGWIFGLLGNQHSNAREPQQPEELREEFQNRILALEESGVLSPTAAHMMHNLLDLREQRVGDHLTAVAATSLQPDDSRSKLRTILEQPPAAPVPVVDTRGKPLGILDLDAALRERDEDSSAAFLQPCPLIEPSASMETALCLLRNPPAPLVMAVPKGAALQGVLTLTTLAGLIINSDAGPRKSESPPWNPPGNCPPESR
ncbi:MAG TPA: CNNM domain-containing protein [Verrucomicrobiales bacterium]|nr:CNNM domain-containing protein [Verrucomicrobiales bacterium]